MFQYRMATLMLVVLLLRMFMAMLTATFNAAKAEATLKWRIHLLQCVHDHSSMISC